MNPSDVAALRIAAADALLITAGAGMGVDSGLPDFRGNQGFWRAYPPFAELGLSFQDLANPQWFVRDPEIAWGFYGHRLKLYCGTAPHAGFGILERWASTRSSGSFVFTSNVDGQFQQAGFDPDRIVECHGSIHHLQCVEPCCEEIWESQDIAVDFDPSTMRAEPPLPFCPQCGNLARPNILMFSDGQWLWRRTEEQHLRLREWLAGLEGKELVIVECGAGTAIPTVRQFSEQLQQFHGATLIRINPREAEGPAGTISIKSAAEPGLRQLDELIRCM